MRRIYSKIKDDFIVTRKITWLAFLVTFFLSIQLNAQTWYGESFNAVGVPADTMPANWTQGKHAGTTTYLNGNGFRRFGASSYPTVGPNGFEGAGFVRFNSRGTPYPAMGAWCVAGDAAFLASPPLDWTGRTNVSPGWISMRFWRSNVITNGLHLVADSISVYLNDRADLTGAVLLTETVTGSTFIPRSSIMAPAGTANAWNLLQYNLPAFGAYGGRFDTSSTVYVVVKATSQGGDNMYLDSLNAPTYPTNMDIQGAQLWYQETADAGKNTTNNLIIGVRFWAHGSLNALKIDSLVFSANGSTAPATDITNIKLWYTGSSQLFTTSTQYDVTTTLANMSFGYGVGTCAAWGVTTPATFQCKPGWNYYWLTYDIPATAVAGHYVDADFVGYNYGTQACVNFRTVNLTASGGRQIDQAYPIPTYTAGTSWAGYTHNDYVSAVETVNGLNGTSIDNWFHDTWVGAPCPADCDRFSPHPPDYTQFQNQAVVISHKQRGPVQVNEGQGVRQGTAPLIIHAAPGTWYSSDCIAVFVDWNKDGDFYDTYTGAPGPVISENYGTQCLSAGIISNPFGIGNPFGTYQLDVPGKTDVVTNVAGTGANMAGGQLFLGNVRMRVREVYAAGVIHPTQSGYTWGEVEDYTINVLDNCPTPATYVCKWIGNTTDWSDPNNWCPSLPDNNHMAYIPVVNSPFVYPVVDSGTIANCRTLKIVDGAHVDIDCPNTYPGNVVSGSMTVTDSIIIGANTTSSTSYLKVISAYKQTIEIPGASIAPPGGVGLTPGSPFKSNQNSKFQVAYTSSELYNVFGLRGGDVIDTLRFLIKTPPLANSNYPNFRIMAFFVNAPVNYPNPIGAGSVAVTAAYPGVTWRDTVFLGPFSIAAGQTTLSLNLLPNKLIWDGVSNLVLSFDYWNTIGAGGFSNLYTETTGGTYNSLSLTSNTGAGTWNAVASGYGFLGVGLPVSSGATGATNNYRPRIYFAVHRRYGRFPITVGKAFVNNNNSGVPVGTNGFVAGNSKVSFDPSVRATVNSPGLFTQTNIWNPTSQSQTLTTNTTADTMKISSGINPQASGAFTIGSSSTVFNELEVKGTAGVPISGSILKQFKNTYADTLTLTSGELNLNQNNFTLKNPASTALTAPAGWIKSEDASGTISSLFTWKIGTSTGAHSIPFGKTNTNIFPFVYTGTAGDVGDLTVGTYGTPTQANTPYPFPALPVGNALHVVTMNDTTVAATNATPWTVDRFWYVDRTTATAITGTMRMQYPNTEGTSTANYIAGQMKAQNYQLSGSIPGWHLPYAGQTDGQVSTYSYVDHPAANIDATYNIWTIVHINASQAPLPIELLNFDAKQVNDKVKIWWDVQNEKDVVDYTVERTINQNDYNFIANVSPAGPSSGILSYETYDENPLIGLQYYRLKTLSNNGDVQYSQLVPVKFNGKGIFAITNVAVNSDAGLITVDFIYDSNLPYNYVLTDVMGKVVANGANKGVEGSNRIEVPATIAQGIYMISIRNTEKTVSAKLKF